MTSLATEDVESRRSSVSNGSTDADRNFWFDAIRGLSALAVCAGHLRATAFVDYAHVENKGVLQKLFYGLTSFGHEAVMVFFVLSGFFVGGSVLKNAENFSFQSYAISRLTRLWLVLIPALLFTAIIDLYLQLNAPGVLSGEYYALWCSGPTLEEYSLSLATFFGNVFFVQNILTPIFGSNGPLWSLANEFWYYVAFPSAVLIFIAKKNQTRAIALTITVFLIVALILIPRDNAIGLILGYFVWLMGVGVYVLKDVLGNKGKYFILPCMFLFVAALAYSKTPNPSILFNKDIVIGFFFSLAAISLVNLQKPKKLPSILNDLVIRLSDISYSLYLFHFPILMVVASKFHTGVQMQLNIESFGIYLFELFVLIAFSVIAWWFFERRTNIVRALVEHLLKRPPTNLK